MNKTLVLDLATHFGYTVLEDTRIVATGNINLESKKIKETYISKTCRRKLPNGSEEKWVLVNDKYCIEKERTITKHLNSIEQKRRLFKWIRDMKTKGINNLVIEGPAVHNINVNSLRKQFGFYSIVELFFDERVITEIRPNDWFKFIRNEFGSLVQRKEDKNGNSIVDRKETSKKTASSFMNKEILDDNEADAINLSIYFIKNYKN